MVNAVVLAGAVDERLSDVYQGPTKALIPVCGKPCVEHVLEALRATPQVARIALAGPAALSEHPVARLADVELPEESSIVDKLFSAAAAFDDDHKLLMVPCDIPLLNPQTLSDVIQRCPDDCAFFHPLVEKSAAVSAFPEHKWLFIKLREAAVVTTNIIVLDPKWLLERPDLARTLEALRQHPTRMALRWGLGFLLKYKLGLLDLRYCERLFSRVLQAPCRGVITDHVDLAMDLDRPEDIPMLEHWLASAPAGGTPGTA